MPRSGLHVIQVVAPASVGGLETVVINLVDGLARAGTSVTIVAALGPHDPLPEAFETLHSAELVVVRGNAKRPDREYRAVTRLLPRADLVHTHGYRPDIVQGVIGRSRPIVSTVHGFTGGGRSLHVYEQMQLRVLRDFSAVVAVSHPLARTLERGGVPPRRIVTIPNAIREPDFLDRAEARRKLGVGPSTFAIGWVGRMSREKNPSLAVEAFRRARTRLRSSELVMIGDGPLRAELEAKGIEGARFLGEVPSAGRYMRGLDALVLSSDTEGTPIVLIEAMWASTPILATRVGGVPHLLDPDQALLVRAGSVGKLSAAMVATLTDHEARSTRAGNARHRAEQRGNVEHWIRRYRSLYDRLSGAPA
ncbi:MAG: glycosyltransferase family 4 protein [Longimicrobiales bacterium]